MDGAVRRRIRIARANMLRPARIEAMGGDLENPGAAASIADDA
jgi:hypothetical protein